MLLNDRHRNRSSRPITSAMAGLLLAGLGVGQLHAAEPVDYPQQGIRFMLPDGWSGREIEQGLLLGSETLPGFVLLMPHEYDDLETLKREAASGLQDDAGTQLKLQGELDSVGTKGVGGEFSGQLDGAAVRAYLVGLINPFGAGITIMAATEPAQYSDSHRTAALEIANSFTFYQPALPPLVEEWRQVLSNRRLAFHHSSYSGSAGGGYSGYSSSEEMHLCAAGHFISGEKESGSFDSGGAFGSMNNSGAGQGRWTIVQQEDASVWLQMTFHDGGVRSYRLEMSEGQTYLNSSRYYRTATDQCG